MVLCFHMSRDEVVYAKNSHGIVAKAWSGSFLMSPSSMFLWKVNIWCRSSISLSITTKFCEIIESKVHWLGPHAERSSGFWAHWSGHLKRRRLAVDIWIVCQCSRYQMACSKFAALGSGLSLSQTRCARSGVPGVLAFLLESNQHAHLLKLFFPWLKIWCYRKCWISKRSETCSPIRSRRPDATTDFEHIDRKRTLKKQIVNVQLKKPRDKLVLQSGRVAATRPQISTNFIENKIWWNAACRSNCPPIRSRRRGATADLCQRDGKTFDQPRVAAQSCMEVADHGRVVI